MRRHLNFYSWFTWSAVLPFKISHCLQCNYCMKITTNFFCAGLLSTTCWWACVYQTFFLQQSAQYFLYKQVWASDEWKTPTFVCNVRTNSCKHSATVRQNKLAWITVRMLEMWLIERNCLSINLSKLSFCNDIYLMDSLLLWRYEKFDRTQEP